jgi:hypothetical protein
VTGGLRSVSITLASGSAQNKFPDLTSTIANRGEDALASLGIIVNYTTNPLRDGAIYAPTQLNDDRDVGQVR